MFRKWGLDAVTIGDVTDDGLLRVRASRRGGGGNSEPGTGGRGAAL